MTINKILGGALAAQIVLATITWWPRPDGPTPQKLVPFEADAITEVRIESTSTRSRGGDLVLAKKDDGWVIASEHDFPVVEGKVEELLQTLTSLTYRTPIATSKVRHEQLYVDDETPTRRVTLKAGEKEHTILLGAASGKRSHVRFPGQDEVYQVEGMGVWKVADGAASYFEREQIAVEENTLKSVRLQRKDVDFELLNDGGSWTLADLQEGEAMDAGRVRELLGALLRISMSRPADPALAEQEALITVSWVDQDGQEGGYRVVEATENHLVIAVGDRPPFEMASVLTRQQLEETRREDLVKPAETAEEGG